MLPDLVQTAAGSILCGACFVCYCLSDQKQWKHLCFLVKEILDRVREKKKKRGEPIFVFIFDKLFLHDLVFAFDHPKWDKWNAAGERFICVTPELKQTSNCNSRFTFQLIFPWSKCILQNHRVMDMMCKTQQYTICSWYTAILITFYSEWFMCFMTTFYPLKLRAFLTRISMHALLLMALVQNKIS